MLPVLYIVGDVHLTEGEGAFHAFLDHLAARPAARLVILGDLFEYWLDTDAAVHRYRACLRRLVALRAAGWRLDLVIGNREMGAGRRLAVATRCQVHWPGLDLRLGGRGVRIVHGDRLCADPGYHLLFAFINGFWFRAWRACVPEFVQERIARWMRRRSRLGHLRKRRERSVVGARPDMLHAARVRAAGRCADTVIAGHIHEQWRRPVAGVDVALVGDWTHTAGHWIEGCSDGSLRLRSYDFSDDAEE